MAVKVHEQLKVATHAYHARLNRSSALDNLMSPRLSMIEYRNILIGYSHLYLALENRIIAYLKQHPTLFVYSERIKHKWLQDDLAVLDVGIQTQYSKTFQHVALPKIDRIGKLIGVLYTIEGSTLGGQVISRCLEKHIGLTQENGACFFNGYGERTISMWQDFLLFAETIAANEDECHVAVDSACQTFQLFEQVLGKG